MDKIRIISPDKVITLMRTRQVYVGIEDVSKEAMMASGRLVKDMIGYRTLVTGEWDAPPAKLTELMNVIEENPFLTVEYPDPKLGDTVGTFEVSLASSPKVWVFRKGEPLWKDVKLEMRSQVVRNA